MISTAARAAVFVLSPKIPRGYPPPVNAGVNLPAKRPSSGRLSAENYLEALTLVLSVPNCFTRTILTLPVILEKVT